MGTKLTVVKHLAATVLTSGGSQNFLGGRHVEAVLRHTRPSRRRATALRLLALSPHYFYSPDLEAENQRNLETRQALISNIVAPEVKPGDRVIDLGCGPGYLARAAADLADEVLAVDVSRGVLACARILNPAPNIRYIQADELAQLSAGTCDLAYSFAVAQHLSEVTLSQSLDMLARALRRGGRLILHFAEPGDFATEQEWRADVSLRGRAKLQFGLHCFGRTEGQMKTLVEASGFENLRTFPVGELMTESADDVTRQHLLMAIRS